MLVLVMPRGSAHHGGHPSLPAKIAMKALQLAAPGGLDHLHLTTLPDAPPPGAGEIQVRIAQRGRELVIEVDNPVQAETRQQQGNRMAQANIRERWRLCLDIEAQMDSGVKDGRYRVRICLPLRREGRA